MKKVIKSVVFFAAIFSTMLCEVSCIKENPDNCPQNGQLIRFQFSYGGADIRAIDPSEITKATVYVFDADNRFIASQVIRQPIFNHAYTAGFNIQPGNYRFVVWINQASPYATTPDFSDFNILEPTVHNAIYRLEIPADRFVRTTIPVSLYGSLENAAITAAGNQLFTIPLTEVTNKINLTVRGLPQNTDIYSYNIVDNNGNYYFDYSIAPCEEFRYTATMSFGISEELKSSLTVLRLATDRHPRLIVENTSTGQTLFPSYEGQSNDLIEMILKAYAGRPLDFEKTHEYDIVISFDTHMKVTLSINGWIVTMDEQEL